MGKSPSLFYQNEPAPDDRDRLHCISGCDLVVGGACVIVGLDVIHHLVHGGEGKTDIAVSAAIIEGDAAGVGILQGGAGEADVGHEAALLIPLFRGQQEVAAPVEHLAGLVPVQNGTADGVHETVAGAGDTVVEQQPALAGLDGSCTAADLHALHQLEPLLITWR